MSNENPSNVADGGEEDVPTGIDNNLITNTSTVQVEGMADNIEIINGPYYNTSAADENEIKEEDDENQTVNDGGVIGNGNTEQMEEDAAVDRDPDKDVEDEDVEDDKSDIAKDDNEDKDNGKDDEDQDVEDNERTFDVEGEDTDKNEDKDKNEKKDKGKSKNKKKKGKDAKKMKN